MVERAKSKVGQLTAEDAKRFLDVRTEGYENPTASCEKYGTCFSHPKACDAIALSEKECLPLAEALTYGNTLEITPEERRNLEKKGYPKPFLDGLGGALQRRAHWLIQKLPIETGGANRAKAYDELASIGTRSEEAFDVLIHELGSENFIFQDKAMTALVEACTAEETMLSKIVVVLKSNPEPEIRAAAASILGRLGPLAIANVPTLILAFDDPNYWVRNQAVQAFGNIYAQSKWADPKLFDVDSVFIKLGKMVDSDPNPICRLTAKQALRKL